MDVKIDMICDRFKSGHYIDGIQIKPSEALSDYVGNSIVVLAVENPVILSESYNDLLEFGFAEKHILPILEHFAVNGRCWREIISNVCL